MEYDTTCLVVWPEWGSSGIWHPQQPREQGAAVRMVSHETLGLPEWLSSRFDKWIDWYDDYSPDRKEAFPWEDFDKEGSVLALELAKFVGDKFSVEYNGKKVIKLTLDV